MCREVDGRNGVSVGGDVDWVDFYFYFILLMLFLGFSLFSSTVQI